MGFPLSVSFYSPKAGSSKLLSNKEIVLTRGFIYLRFSNYSYSTKVLSTVRDILWKYLIAGLAEVLKLGCA